MYEKREEGEVKGRGRGRKKGRVSWNDRRK
jgi:hypothetical protein